MKIDRRRALVLLGMSAATPAAAQTPQVSFKHGVASGDPGADRIILWTRITPDVPGADVPYTWKLTPVDRRAGGAKSGAGVTGPGRDYTAKVDVRGLDPARSYTFEFSAGGVTSPTGRTRTLPAGPTKDVVLAVASCSLFPEGYFNAYQAIADLPRVDAVVHLGDYIYEYGGPDSYGMTSSVAAERPHEPNHDIVTLADYRRRHAQYKTDPALQAAHARVPWIVAWDDHETANNSYKDGAENHHPETEGDWNARKAAALRAYYEWMPIREPQPGQSLAEASARSFRFGDLMQLVMLETRLTARGLQLDYGTDLKTVDGKPDVEGFRKLLNDPDRRMMSPAQETWLESELTGSVKAGHAWQVIGSGVVMGRLLMPVIGRDLPADVMDGATGEAKRRLTRMNAIAKLNFPYGLDMWDGYPADRERVYDAVRRAKARPVVISGDSHAFWANELSDAKGKRVAVEFGGTSITSPGGDKYFENFKIGPAFEKASPEVLFNDQGAHGFILLTLNRKAALGELMAVSSITSKTFETKPLKRFRAVPDGAGISGLSEV